MPIITSFIRPPYNLADLRDQNQALHQKTKSNAVSNGIHGKLQRHGDLAGPGQAHADFKHIPTCDGKEKDPH